MNTKQNQRFRGTEEKIEALFLALLEEKPLSKITVQELCRGADINRTTFYAHYEDIYGLLRKVEERMSTQVADILIDKETNETRPFNKTWIAMLLTHIKQNEAFYRASFNDLSGNNNIRIHLMEAGKTLAAPLFKASEKSGLHDSHYKLAYYEAGMTAIIRLWLNSGCPETPEELAAIITTENNLRMF